MTSDDLAPAPAADPSKRASKTTLRAAGVIFAATFGGFVSVTPTVVAAVGVFLKTIAAEFHWPRSEVASALAAIAFGTAVASPLTGRLADKIGARKTALIGSLALAFSIMLISQIPAQPILYVLAFFLAGAAGAMPNTLVFSKILATWFDRTRGLWIGFIGGVGVGGGALLFPMLAATLLARYDWRLSFLIIGLLVLLAGFPVLYLLLREAPVQSGATAIDESLLEGLTWAQAMRTPRFWWIFSVIPVGAGCMTAMFTTIVPLLTDRGFSVDTAILTIQAFALTTLFVEPASGWLADRTSSPKIIAPLFLIAAIGLWMLLHVHTQGLLLVSGALIGVGAGVEYSVMLYLLSRYFGLKAFGAIAGTAFAGTLFCGAVAPIALNAMFDLTGRYDIAVYAIIAILIYSSIAVLTFGPYPFKLKHHA